MRKTILITGASSGIGKATARLFADNGWSVVATMRDPAKETELAGVGDVLVTRLDVRDRGSIGQAIKTRNVNQDYVDFVRSRFPSQEVAQ